MQQDRQSQTGCWRDRNLTSTPIGHPSKWAESRFAVLPDARGGASRSGEPGLRRTWLSPWFSTSIWARQSAGLLGASGNWRGELAGRRQRDGGRPTCRIRVHWSLLLAAGGLSPCRDSGWCEKRLISGRLNCFPTWPEGRGCRCQPSGVNQTGFSDVSVRLDRLSSTSRTADAGPAPMDAFHSS